jgi:hypothetical protein
MADELDSFALLFLGPNGEESPSWDSTQLERSSSLPTAVEIQVALASADMYDDTDPEVYKRRALIRVRPLDFEKLLDPTGESGGQDDEDDEDNEDDEANEGSGDSSDSDDGNTNTAGMTIGECVDLSAIDESIPHGDLLRSLVAGNPNLPWDRSDGASLPASIVRPACR